MSQLEPEVLVLEAPADKQFADVARLMVAGLGARMDFNYDDVEDLKIAVDEAFTRAVEQPDHNVRLEFLIFSDRLEICLKGVPPAIWSENQRQLILKAVTDEVKLEPTGETCDLHLIKYRQKKTA